MTPGALSSFWDRLPFAGRLLVTASVALLVAGAAMLYGSARGDAQQARIDLTEQLDAELQILPGSLAELLVIGDFATLQQSLDRHVSRPNIVHIRCRDNSGAVLEGRDRPVPAEAPAAFARWLDVSDMTGSAEATVGGRRYGSLEVTLTAQHAINHAWHRLIQHLAILLLAIAIDFLGIWMVLRAGLKPLAALDAGAQALSSGNLAVRIPPRGSPELRRSIEAFNGMAAAIQEAHGNLVREKERIQVTLASIGDAVIATDAGGRIDFMNPIAETLTGWSVAEARGLPVAQVFRIVRERTGLPVDCPVAKVLKEGRIVGLANHTLLIARDGSQRPVADSAAPIRDGRGEIAGAVLVFRDQSDERRRLHQLGLLASVFEHAHEGIVITDPGGRILDVNPTFTELTGYARHEAVGRTPALLSSGHHGAEFYAGMWQTLASTGHWRGEIWNRRKNGEVYAELLTISAVRDADGELTHYMGVFSDITLQKQHQERLERIAHYDALTQLPNRVLLADRLQLALAQTKRAGNLLAVCYLDLDGFKPVNDDYGHEAGDRLLVEVAGRLKGGVRGGDTVARLGGDEFALLLSGLADWQECEKTLSRLLRLLAEPYGIDGHVVSISASIGVTLYPLDDADADTLLRNADQAMYAAKQAGRNRFHLFDSEHDRRLRAHRESLARIEAALRAGEFRLHFQPKVNMRQGTVIGAEALIRWQHPERGLLPPAEFLPATEDSDLSVAIGEWVLDTALGHLAEWQQAGIDLSVSVNLSARHLQDERFAARLAELLARHPAAPPGRLELEVLETAALEDITRVSAVIEECRRLGVSFALDDFGTGYSSLTYFRRLPASMLKIDQSFVRDMLKDPEDMAIVEGVIGLTEAFRRNVIAEGVETVEHGVMLLHMGCELGQGYGIARPMPPEELPGWVASFKPDPMWSEVAGVQWAREDLPLLNAELDHRRWVEELAALIALPAGEGAIPTALDTHECRFGKWYDGPGAVSYGALEEFRALAPLHERVHALGRELLALKADGQAADAVARLPELLSLRDDMVTSLQTLLITAAMSRKKA